MPLRVIGMRSMGACGVAFLIGIGTVAAAPPGEVQQVRVDRFHVTWNQVSGATDYNVYRGLVSWMRRGDGAVCHADEVVPLGFSNTANPPLGEAFFYLVTAESMTGEEGTAGTGTGGAPHRLRGRCDAVVRHHVLNRIGFGEDEWTRARIAALGLQGYLNQQLDPASIDESTNNDLFLRTAPFLPPDHLDDLQALDLLRSVHSRRQLEQQMTLFWNNHFNTDFFKTLEAFSFYDPNFPQKQSQAAATLHDEALTKYRDVSFNGTFRELVEASGLGGAMIIYLDTVSNLAGRPNENYARELLELHTMGVGGGYTQQDIVQLAKVFTGWNVCKKDAAVASDPLAACIVSNFYGTADEPPGLWVTNFRPSWHDTSQKVLFAGTPYEVVIPSTAADPAAGVDDARLAFDAIVRHPSTPRFIAKKLLQRFVDEQPTTAMINSVVAAWNNPANPRGIGDLREVLRAVLSQAAFRDPARAGGKLKSPFEHVVSALRALRGRTDGLSMVEGYLDRMSEMLYENPVPTGFPEIGADWVDTNNLLERQNFGYKLTESVYPYFGADVIGLLNTNGISTAASPNNAAAIVDFLSGILFAGNLTATERQRAIDYLNTDDFGRATVYTDGRIRETAAFLMGYPQFLEQ